MQASQKKVLRSQLSSNPEDYKDMPLDEAMELLEPVKEEPKFGTKEWFEQQVWTKAFRKQFGLKLIPFKRSKKKQGRNTLCECGSEIKYKRCCGK